MKRYIFLFVAVVLGSPSWLLIQSQVSVAPPEFCVGVRYLVAFFILMGYLKFKGGRWEQFPLRIWGLIFLEGVFLFSINLWLCYHATPYMITGLIAVILSTLILPNMLFGRIFLKIPVRPQALLGALMGLCGVVLLFAQELSSVEKNQALFIGGGLTFGSMFFTVIGTQISAAVLKRGVPVVENTAYALLVGGVISLATSLLWDGFPQIPVSFEFWGALLYLAAISSALTFVLYNHLIKGYGPGTASYLWIIMPAVCLALSSWIEGYNWTGLSTLGVLVILAGGLLSGMNVSPLTILRKRGVPVITPPRPTLGGVD